MDEMFDEATSPSATETDSEPALAENDATSTELASAGAEPAPAEPAPAEPEPAPAEDPALTRFTSCRWHATQDNGGAAYCSHRDVQPYAGKNGFNPQAWCIECEFFKVRRTVKKRNPFDLDDY